MRSPISKILKMAVRRKYIATNPLEHLEDDELPKGKAKRESRVLSRDEIANLLQHAVPSYKVMLATLVFAGLRMQELLGLQWGDIDFEEDVIRLRFQLSRATKEKPGERVKLKAKGSPRDIRLLPDLRALLQEHRKEMLLKGLYRAEGFVFVTQAGRPFYHRNVAVRGLDKAADRAGLNPEGKHRLQAHDLRRTFGSHLALSGLDVVRVSRQIGHSRPSVTLDVYAKEFEQAAHSETLATKLEEALGGILG
jgi:integrase